MTCPSELLLSTHADGELTGAEAVSVATHLDSCHNCQGRIERLNQENAVLMEVLAEPLVEGARGADELPMTLWLWGSALVAVLGPALLVSIRQVMPEPPPGVAWLGELSALVTLLRGLMEFMTGGHDMLVSLVGFVGTLLLVVSGLSLAALWRHPLLRVGASAALVLFACLGWSSGAHAAEFRSEEGGTVKISANELIDDTVFLSGKTAIVAGEVAGDVFAAGDRIEITGKVRGNVYSAGETIAIGGSVMGNVHAAGKDIEINGEVGGSGFLAGQNVIVAEGASLERDGYFAGESVRVKGKLGRSLHFAGEKVELSGSVERSVLGYANRFALNSHSSVGGDLEVTVPAKDATEIDEGASVKGDTRIEIDAEEDRREFLHVGFYLGVLARALALLLIGLILVALFPALLPRIPTSSRVVLRNMGIGFVVLFATPVAIVIGALTVIGIPTSIVLAMVYALLAYTSTLVLAYFAGFYLPVLKKSHIVLRTALCLVALLLLVKLPLVGLGLNFLVHLFGVGCLTLHIKARFDEGRRHQVYS